jgi:hypothetical protein
MDHTSCIAVTVGKRQPLKEGGGSVILPAPVQGACRMRCFDDRILSCFASLSILLSSYLYSLTHCMPRARFCLSAMLLLSLRASPHADAVQNTKKQQQPSHHDTAGSANTPITVTVAQNDHQVAIVCRTLLITNLSCSVQGKKIEFTLLNPDGKAKSSLLPSGFRVVGNNEVEAKKWKRVVDLPCAVNVDSKEAKQIDDHTIVFTFTKAL